MITALAWVPRGAARERPVRFELSEEEYDRIRHLASLEEAGEVDADEARKGILDSDSDSDAGGSNAEEQELGNDDDLPAEYNMDDYDAEDAQEFRSKRGAHTGGAFGKDSNGDDDDNMDTVALMETHGVALAMDADSEDEDADDDQINPTDSLLVVALTEDEHSHLEVQLLSEDGSIYTHHDIALPEFPLCLAWLDCPPYREGETEGGDLGTLSSSVAAERAVIESGKKEEGQRTVGNYIAVGSFQSGIEIWNLDVLDPIEPAAVLGGTLQDEELEAYQRAQRKASSQKSKGKGKGKKTVPNKAPTFDDDDEEEKVFRDGSHTDAVMCLAWNSEFRQLLASGSADHTVKVWDMTTRSCSHTFTHHTDKVQCVLWHPTEAHILASGGFDKRVCMADCRSGTIVSEFQLPADIESMVWDSIHQYILYCACEDGSVVAFDVRSTDGAPLSSWQAHAKTCTSVSCSPVLEGFLVTSSVDKTVRVWDTRPLHEAAALASTATTEVKSKGKGKKGSTKATEPKSNIQPKIIAQKKLNAGKLFAMQCYKDSPFVLAAGGDKGSVAIWLSDEWEPIRSHFADRIRTADGANNDVLRAQIGSSGTTADIDSLREPIFATHGSDSEDEDDESDIEGDMDAASLDGSADDPADYEDESWMEEEKIVAKKSSKKNTSSKKGKK